MIMLNANINYIPPVSISYSAGTPVGLEEFGATETILGSLKIGNTIYRFLQEISVKSVRNHQTEDWICWSSSLDDSIVGKGDTFSSAENDFRNQLHAVFQKLYRKRPFEMNAQESSLWEKLVNVIDVHHYRTTTPLIVREVGQVSYGMISRPYQIKWLTGHNYIIDSSRVPDNLMSMRTGQYIDAVVKRDPVTHKVLEIVSVKSISFHLPNNNEAKRIWEEMPVAQLPEGGWD
jgi:hypothetical protein